MIEGWWNGRETDGRRADGEVMRKREGSMK